ncbi:MAG: hypothetical protein ACXWCY_12610 [Burkholderiales bacterium]
MNERMKLETGATLVDRINSIQMSDTERLVAVDAMRTARLLVDAWLWITRQFGQSGAGGGFTKVTPQH